MVQELMYTSAPRGLRPGTRGFCTVAATRGMSPVLMEKLESLSGYRALFPPNDPHASANPVAFSHVRINVAGKAYSVLSRVCAAGLDYSERSNKFAHHLVLQAGEMPRGGPAWLMQQPDVLTPAWNGTVQWLAPRPPLPLGDSPSNVCHAWRQMTRDAGWAGAVAESLLKSPESGVCVVFQPGTKILPLVGEVLSLLPVEQRWGVTFSTYSAGLPQGLECRWRCYAAGTVEAKSAVKAFRGLVLSLTADLGTAKGGALVERARTGRAPEAPIALPAEVPEAFAVPEVDVARRLNPAARPYAAQAWGDDTPLQGALHPGSAAGITRPPPLRTSAVPARRSRRRWLMASLLVCSLVVAAALYSARKLGVWPHRSAEANAELAESLPMQSDRMQIASEHATPKPDAQRDRPSAASSAPLKSAALAPKTDKGKPDPPKALHVSTESKRSSASSGPPAATRNDTGLAPEGRGSRDRVAEDYFDIPRYRQRNKVFTLRPGAGFRSANLRLVGLPPTIDGVVVRFKNDESTNVWSLNTEQSKYAGRKIASFTLDYPNLIFAWNELHASSQYEKYWHVLRNCVLTISRPGERETYYALRAPLECGELTLDQSLPGDPQVLQKTRASYKRALKPLPRHEVDSAALYLDHMVIVWRDDLIHWDQTPGAPDNTSVTVTPHLRSRKPFRVVSGSPIRDDDGKPTFDQYISLFETVDELQVNLVHDQEQIELRPRTKSSEQKDSVPVGSPKRATFDLHQLPTELRIKSLVLYMKVGNDVRVDVYRIGSAASPTEASGK